MKKFLLFALILISMGSCKKAIQDIQEDMVIKAMTNGQWKVTSFTQNGNDITSTFSNYKFQYYSNKTVDAILNGTVNMTGQWDGNATARTTWASFNTSSAPLSLINGTWQINDSGWTYVIATQVINGETRNMRLDKL